MGRIAIFRHALIAVASAAVGMLPACGGDDGTDAAPELQAQPAANARLALEGQRVSGRDEALQIVARGVVAPLVGSELAHAVLARAFERRANAPSASPPASGGDRWVLALDAQVLDAGAVLAGPVAIEIEVADNAEGLILRGEAGFVRALLRFEQVALGAAGHIDGVIVLEVSRTAAGAGAARRSQADALSISDGNRTLHWSYLNIEVDAQQLVQMLNVVSDLPLDGSDRVWLDVTTSNATARRYIATGVVGFLKARLTLQMAADGGWTIDVDNDKDDRVDFVVQASAAEARALMLGP
jgi:hypothetical protein